FQFKPHTNVYFLMIENIAIILLSVINCGETNVSSVSWVKLIDRTSDWIHKTSLVLEKDIIAINVLQNISNACNDSIWQTFNSVKNLDVWAVQMMNSWGTFPPRGALLGTNTDFGSYDQCLAIEPNTVINEPQYCLIDISPPIPKSMPIHHNLYHQINIHMNISQKYDNHNENVFKSYSEFASFHYWISFRTAICTPSKCTPNDVSLLANGFADYYGLELKQIRCETKDTCLLSNESSERFACIHGLRVLTLVWVVFSHSTEWTNFQLFSRSFRVRKMFTTIESQLVLNGEYAVENFFFIGGMLTSFISLKYTSGKLYRFNALGFLLVRYLRLTPQLFVFIALERFACIHGLRVLTLVWVVFSHSTEWTNFQLFSRSFRVRKMFTSIESQLVLNGEYAVENFFFIGGMLTSFISLKYTSGKLYRFNALGFLLVRYLRLTPQLFVFMLLTFLMPLGGWASGPLWRETITPIIDNCSTNWWWNVFYIQNLFKAPQICAIHSWFLACDMQYHWFSLLLVIPVLYRFRLGVVLAIGTIVLCYVISIIIGNAYDLPPGLINTGRDQHFLCYYIDLFYIKPWSHSTVFFIGFLFGLIAYKNKTKKLDQKYRFCIIVSAIIGYIACLMDTYHWNDGKPHTSLLSALIFSTCAPQICAIHSWFLACDMQYHWFSLLLVIPVLYRFRLGVVLTIGTIVLFYIISIIIGNAYDLPPGLINTGRDQHFLLYYIDLFYIKPWSHSTVFFIGFLFGLIAYKNKTKKLDQKYRFCIIVSAIIGYIACLMDTYHWNDGKPHTSLLSALIFSTCRVVWALSTGALVWLCISGNGGFIDRCLSAPILIPLSRLTYSVYLTHVWVIWVFVGTRRERIDANVMEIMLIFIHNLVISYIIGFLFALLFEMPVIKLQKRLTKRFVKTVDRPEETELAVKF
ncbi:unnamed protein product, partial [Medioppia subpectinata]